MTTAGDDPISVAKRTLSDSIKELVATEDFDDLTWLPGDFADQLVELAWQYRAEIGGGRFKREVRALIKRIAPTGEEGVP